MLTGGRQVKKGSSYLNHVSSVSPEVSGNMQSSGSAFVFLRGVKKKRSHLIQFVFA